jgi:DNA-directed RNA polymerase III subunit RPC11
MHFCPVCGSLLLIEEAQEGMRYCCPTCTYARNIEKVYHCTVKVKNKEVGDVMGGDDAWENVDKTEAKCENCNHTEAYFMQIQIRSADEPSTCFYKCVRCKHQWNDK